MNRYLSGFRSNHYIYSRVRKSYCSHYKVWLILYLLISVNFIQAQDEDFSDSMPINQIKVLGSHNSYRRMTDAGILKTIHLIDPFYGWKFSPAMHLEYDHIPIDSQLEYYGLRSLEIDIYNDPDGGRFYSRQGNALRGKSTNSHIDALLKPGMKVLHIPDVDYNTNYITFIDAIQAIKKWSAVHPTHLPIYVMIELKDDAIGDHIKLAGFKTAIPFDVDAILKLKEEILSIYDHPDQQLLTPDALRADYPSLRVAINSTGFPLLQDTRGKVVFILMTTKAINEKICSQFPSYKSLPFFTFSEANRDEAVFVKCDDPIVDFEKIRALVSQGYMVRTRSDVETEQARMLDYSMFHLAKESGAQIISTDYYQPYYKTGFVIKRSMLK